MKKELFINGEFALGQREVDTLQDREGLHIMIMGLKKQGFKVELIPVTEIDDSFVKKDLYTNGEFNLGWEKVEELRKNNKLDKYIKDAKDFGCLVEFIPVTEI